MNLETIKNRNHWSLLGAAGSLQFRKEKKPRILDLLTLLQPQGKIRLNYMRLQRLYRSQTAYKLVIFQICQILIEQV